MAFDIEGAKKAGYSEKEIADHLAQDSNFDIAAARKAGYSDGEILAHLSESNNQTPAPVASTPAPNGQTDVPLTQNMQGYQQQQQFLHQPQQPEPSLYDKNIGVLKAAGVMVGNAIPSTIGALGGAIYGAGTELAGAPSGSGADYMAAGAKAFSPFSTQDPLANQYMDKVGNILGAVDPNIGVGMQNISAAGIAPQTENAINALSGKNANRAIADRILAGGTEKDLAPYTLPQANKPLTQAEVDGINPIEQTPQRTGPAMATKDALAQEAIKQGYDPGFISSIKAKNPETQRAAAQMVDISEKGKNDMDYRYNNRPSDIVGDALMKPIRYVQKVNSDAGKSLDGIAQDLKGQPIDYEKPLGEFKNSIENLGVEIGDNGALNFDNSSIRFSSGDKKLIKNIYAAANSTDGMDAFQAHKLKRLIDTTVDYGKNPSGSGITNAGEDAVKKFRSSIDDELDSKFPAYDQANTRYSDSINALNDIQDAAGKRIDLSSTNASSALGTRLRGLLSNQQGRIGLKDAIEQLTNVGKKYGGEFKEDIPTLVGAADELDRVHGSHAQTSFLGDTEKGTSTGVKNAQRDLSNMTLLGGALTAGAKVVDHVRRITPETQYRSLRKLLSRDAAKEPVEAAQ